MSRAGRHAKGASPSPNPDPAPEAQGVAAADVPAEEAKRPVSGARRRTMPEPAPEAPSGYRSSRRSSKTGKQARKQAKTERVKAEVAESASRVKSGFLRGVRLVLGLVVAAAVVFGVMWGAALGINAFARWNARRLAAAAGPNEEARIRENLLVIGVQDDQAVGFLAMRADREGKRVVGISIPDGAFVDVPGQGFERLGDSYSAGPRISVDAVANYLSVPFRHYAVVDGEVYQAMLRDQDVGDLVDRMQKTDLTKDQRADLSDFLDSVPQSEVWLVPLPVKSVAVGDQRYFEPQRQEIADLILEWWEVHIQSQRQAVRVIVYNGVGAPGAAGKAAQQLIRAGFRVVDSKNADRFDYKTTKILLYHGTQQDALRVRDVLGAGEVEVQSAAQDLADIMVIIGSDYAPPPGDG